MENHNLGNVKFGLVSTGDNNLAFGGYVLTTSYLEATKKPKSLHFLIQDMKIKISLN